MKPNFVFFLCHKAFSRWTILGMAGYAILSALYALTHPDFVYYHVFFSWSFGSLFVALFLSALSVVEREFHKPNMIIHYHKRGDLLAEKFTFLFIVGCLYVSLWHLLYFLFGLILGHNVTNQILLFPVLQLIGFLIIGELFFLLNQAIQRVERTIILIVAYVLLEYILPYFQMLHSLFYPLLSGIMFPVYQLSYLSIQEQLWQAGGYLAVLLGTVLFHYGYASKRMNYYGEK